MQKVPKSRKLLTKRNSKNIYIPNKQKVKSVVHEWGSVLDLPRGKSKGNKGTKAINKQLGKQRKRPDYNRSNNIM